VENNKKKRGVKRGKNEGISEELSKNYERK
jgi:hypothetical protein